MPPRPPSSRASSAPRAVVAEPGANLVSLLTHVGRQAARSFGDTVAELQLRPQHVELLRILVADPGLSQRRLCARLGVQPNQLVPLLDTVEARGLVRRVRSTSDRRVNGLVPTDEGRETVAEIDRRTALFELEWFACLSAAERRRLTTLLAQLARYHGLAHSQPPAPESP